MRRPQSPWQKKYAPALLLFLIVPAIGFTDEAKHKFESEIQAFEQQDKTTPPPKDAILFVGSSTIRFWDTKAGFPQYTTIQRGFGGSEFSDAVFFADRIVTPYKPKAIVLYDGDNDTAGGKTAQQVSDDFKAFVTKVREKLPDTPIILISIKPSVLRKKLMPVQHDANALMEAYCKQEKHLYYCDIVPDLLDKQGEPRPELLRPDGLHLNDAGYKMLNEKMAKELQTVLAKESAPTK